MERHIRSIFKALSWRVIATLITFLTAWLLTGTVEIAAKIGLLDTVIKLVVFYGHERFWNKLNFGKIQQPEYQI
ncbi:MAG: DUF2061 domain-containing protein [Planctomycetes bacterium]|nr:DUF2061 domain-containing protein [Planctomycetota bacterium]